MRNRECCRYGRSCLSRGESPDPSQSDYDVGWDLRQCALLDELTNRPLIKTLIQEMKLVASHTKGKLVDAVGTLWIALALGRNLPTEGRERSWPQRGPRTGEPYHPRLQSLDPQGRDGRNKKKGHHCEARSGAKGPMVARELGGRQ